MSFIICGLEVFEEAQRGKIEKYCQLAEELSTRGKRAIVEAIVILTLGSWDPANDKSLRHLCSKNT